MPAPGVRFAVGVTTAPRGVDYLARTLASLKAAGWERPTVFAEPGSPIPAGHCPGQVVQRDQSLGIFGNWRQSLLDLLDGDAEAILLCQDDVVLCRGARARLERDLWPTPRTGCVSLYCGAPHATGRGLTRIRRKNIWGACALVFPRDAAARLIDHRLVRNWRRSKKVDILVGSVLNALHLELWAYSPSLAQHVGAISTPAGQADATGKRTACDFLGEEADARYAPPPASAAEPRSRTAPS